MNDHIYLAHHGIKGMKWGVRRFQNPDGSLTSAGKKRYYQDMKKDMHRHYESQISNPEARRIARIGVNGREQLGMDWGEAYRAGKVTGKDLKEIKQAAKNTREYMQVKYGKSACDALIQSSIIWPRPKDQDFEIRTGMDWMESITRPTSTKHNPSPREKRNEAYKDQHGIINTPKDRGIGRI